MDGGDTANYMLQMWSFMNGWAASRDNANGSGGVENIELNGNVWRGTFCWVTGGE